MPRATYADRLRNLLDGPMSSNDKRFASSLLDYYTRKGRLSAGRARCVAQLEERYSPENIARAATENAELIGRLGDVSAHVAAGSWAGDFVASLTEQVQTGRSLSPRQIEILAKIERENSAEAAAANKAFADSYTANTDDLRTKAEVAARYYRHTGYFAKLSNQILDESGFVPSEKAYRKMVENKYAQKVIDAHYSAPKYAVGSFVALRASAPWGARNAAGNKPCVVIQANAAPITSAARGSKIYKVLPVGAAKPVLVEERYIKVARKLK